MLMEMNSTTNIRPISQFRFLAYQLRYQQYRDATPVFQILQCRAKTARKTVVLRYVSKYLPIINYSAKRGTAVMIYTFFYCTCL